MLSKYKMTIISFIVVISIIGGSLVLKNIPWINSDISTLILTIGGLLFSVFVSFLWMEYNAPILRIIEKTEKGEKIPLNPSYPEYYQIQPIGITIENTGRSSAKGCKGYFITDTKKGRVCWKINTERPTATINFKDNERLDLFGFHECVGNGETIVIPSENGWYDHDAKDDSIKPNQIYTVLITSDNAKPVEKKFKINCEDRELQFLK